MEKIKVNMSPNPLDVQTIHASQNDTEARQWEFELHNNGELIDTSEVTEQMVFKSYKGGTEQLLPENTSTPTTSPFKGDIKYPQGLLTDQEFTYRQSPTEEDGFAKITDIKGNTLVWNQLVQNGNFADSSLWTVQSTTISISNNIANVTLTAKGTYVALRQSIFASVTGHKYFVTATFKSAKKTAIGFYLNGQGAYLDGYDIQANTLTKVSALINGGESGGFNIYVSRKNELDVGDVVQVSNVMLFDLTQMGLDITDPSDFTSLFPLSYYSYNQGSLLSFNGNGIKTVGKNQYNNAIGLRNLYLNQNTGLLGNGGTTYVADLLTNKQYTLSGTRGNRSLIGFSKKQASELGNGDTIENISSVPLPYTFNSSDYHSVVYYSNNEYVTTLGTDVQLEFGSVASDFEPYTSSTLSLPISTYFPSGMKSAGNVYDELTESKAITRIGRVDLGTITYTYDGECFIGRLPSDAKVLSANTETLNSITPMYQINNWTTVKFYKVNMTLGTGVSRYICIFNTSYTDPTAFKTAMSGVYLYYELATPTETSFTTASLVTENAEIPLSNNDGTLIGKCTEELSAEPGFHDAKIKLSDSDGECYSNKLQLHIERSPQ